MIALENIFHNFFRLFHMALGGNGALSSYEFRGMLFLVIGAAFCACLMIIIIGRNRHV